MPNHEADLQPAAGRQGGAETDRDRAPAGPDTENDPLLHLLERWEERYRRQGDASPESLGLSRATADRYWAYAKAFLFAALQDEHG